MITEQFSHFMCFASGLSIFAKTAELVLPILNTAHLKQIKREVSCLFRCYDDEGLQIPSEIDDR